MSQQLQKLWWAEGCGISNRLTDELMAQSFCPTPYAYSCPNFPALRVQYTNVTNRWRSVCLFGLGKVIFFYSKVKMFIFSNGFSYGHSPVVTCTGMMFYIFVSSLAIVFYLLSGQISIMIGRFKWHVHWHTGYGGIYIVLLADHDCDRSLLRVIGQGGMSHRPVRQSPVMFLVKTHHVIKRVVIEH